MNRPRAKRILGMTSPQWLVLGILLLLLCAILVGGYSWLNSRVAGAYVVPQLDLPMYTPPPTSTALPTATIPPTPTSTPITYESLVPAGWKQFQLRSGSNLEIWFPESYGELTADDLKKFKPLFEGQQDGKAKSLLVLKDTTPSSYLVITSFELWTRPLVGSDLDAVIDTQLGSLLREGRLLERGDFVFKLGEHPARRLVFDININGMNAGLAVYVVQSGRDLYFLGFATAFNDLYARLPAFDQVIQTFHITPILPTPTSTPTLTATLPPPTNTPLP